MNKCLEIIIKIPSKSAVWSVFTKLMNAVHISQPFNLITYVCQPFAINPLSLPLTTLQAGYVDAFTDYNFAVSSGRLSFVVIQGF